MALFDIYLDVAPEYLQTVQDIYKFTIVLIVFQIMVHYSFPHKNIIGSALSGIPVNDEFSCLLIFMLMGLAFYHLVAQKIIMFY
jgi:hypothetical protein